MRNKTTVKIERLNDGSGYVIVEGTFQWCDTFQTEEEATTYALREKCRVIGTAGDVVS